ncbi:MAG: nucleotidyltransferase family protein [Rhodospirillaceae bacterium]
MTFIPLHTAMILAAGLGSRMHPLTDNYPKPMIKVRGKALIDWVLDDLAKNDITTAIVNVHYKAPLLIKHLAKRNIPNIIISDETELLLDTGGAVLAALPLVEDDLLLVTNSDALWGCGLGPAISTLLARWDDDIDSLILLAPMRRAHGFDGAGDFFIEDNDTPVRRGKKPTAPYVYAGIQIIHRRLFNKAPGGVFSFNALWDKAHQEGRLKAALHDDDWYHVGTPDSVEQTGQALKYNLAHT